MRRAGASPVAVVGAGAVGLLLASRLGRGGAEVHVWTRRLEVARALGDRGVELCDLADGEITRVPCRAHGEPGFLAELPRGTPVVYAARAPELRSLADRVAEHAPGLVAVAAQNGVDAEATLARPHACVVGLLLRQTCSVSGPARVSALGPGRVVLGLHSDDGAAHGAAALARLAAWLRRAGVDVGVSGELAADRWLKLCVNLLSTPNALVRRADHRSTAFVELKAGLLEEARAVLGAAGHSARSCDGRDRDLDQEIAALRASLRDGTSARALPLYNSVWSALERPGAPLEAGTHHARIIALGERYGVETPLNRRVRERLLAAVAAGEGPECTTAHELLGASPELG